MEREKTFNFRNGFTIHDVELRIDGSNIQYFQLFMISFVISCSNFN